VAEVVHPELHLDALRGAGLVDRHQSGVVDEDVKPVMRGEQAVGEGGDGVEVGEVEAAHPEPGGGTAAPHLVGCGVRLGGVAAGQDDLRAAGGQGYGDLKAEPGVGAGDHGRAAGQVGDVGRGPGHDSSKVNGRSLLHDSEPWFILSR
jgi:hypothetical protein